MPYFQLRITLSETRTHRACLLAIKALSRTYNLGDYSCGVEQYNKYGEPCDPHIHFNFVCDLERVNPKRCIQDFLRRHFMNRDIELKGNKMWSLQMVEEPQDYDRWLRYPLKEQPINIASVDKEWGMLERPWTFFAKEGVGGEELRELYNNLRQRAVDERKTSIEMNILRREKLRVKDQFKQKMYDYIDEETKEGETDKRVIWTTIFTYYRKIEKPINFNTIEGYTNLWLADHGVISPDGAFDLAHNYQNN